MKAMITLYVIRNSKTGEYLSSRASWVGADKRLGAKARIFTNRSGVSQWITSNTYGRHPVDMGDLTIVTLSAVEVGGEGQSTVSIDSWLNGLEEKKAKKEREEREKQKVLRALESQQHGGI